MLSGRRAEQLSASPKTIRVFTQPGSEADLQCGLYRNWEPPSRQLFEQRLGLLQVQRVEAFGEPTVDGGEQLARRRRRIAEQICAKRILTLLLPTKRLIQAR
jgi:hypothetical protein